MARLGRGQPTNVWILKGTPAAQIIVAIGTAEETDTAQAITVNPIRRLVDQASEADTANAVTARKTVTLGQANETDTSQAVTVNPIRRLVDQATEADTANAVTARKTVTLGQASETDTGQAVTVLHSSDLVLLTPAHNSTVDFSDGETFTWLHPGAQTEFAFRRRLEPGGAWEWWNGTGWTGSETFIASADEEVTIPAGDW